MVPRLDSFPQEIREQILLQSLPLDPSSSIYRSLKLNREAANKLSCVFPGVAAEMPWVWRTWLQQRLVVLAVHMRDCDVTRMYHERRMQCRTILHHLCLVVEEVLAAFEKSKTRDDIVAPMETTIRMCESALLLTKCVNGPIQDDSFERNLNWDLDRFETHAVGTSLYIQKSKDHGWSFPLHLYLEKQ